MQPPLDADVRRNDDVMSHSSGQPPESVDQTKLGDRWYLVADGVHLDVATAKLTLQCGGRSCVADAVLVESEARYNDGSSVTGQTPLTIPRKDGIVLRRVPPPSTCQQ